MQHLKNNLEEKKLTLVTFKFYVSLKNVVLVESWIYSLFHAIKGKLPWENSQLTQQQKLESRKAFWGKKKNWKFLKNLPKQVIPIMDLIQGIEAGGPIDYNAIIKMLEEVIAVSLSKKLN